MLLNQQYIAMFVCLETNIKQIVYKNGTGNYQEND